MLLLPNLRVLSLDLPPWPSFLAAAVDQATTVIPSYSSRPLLQSLCHLSLHARHYATPCDATHLELFFRNHHPKSLQVHHSHSSNMSPWIFEPFSCDISTPTFRYTCITYSLLGQMFILLSSHQISNIRAQWSCCHGNGQLPIQCPSDGSRSSLSDKIARVSEDRH